MKWPRRILIGIGALLGALFTLAAGLFVYVQITWDRPIVRSVPQLVVSNDPLALARGEHLYNQTMLCWTCHGSQGSYSPSEPQAGGREFDATKIGPGFGYFYASNLTPDKETGIGSWSDGELVRAIREGLDREGRLIFPIMPYEWYHDLSDDDALALVAYMRSLPPLRNPVAGNQWSFPAQTIVALGLVKPLSEITSPVVAPPAGPTAEYGKYLANQASGCAECHSPRDVSNGQYDTTRLFGGGLFPFLEEGFSTIGPNLTPDAATGIGSWTQEQFIVFMRQGTRPDGTVALPFMPWPYYARWSEDDLKAAWLYLGTLKSVDHKTAPSELTGKGATGTGVERGEGIFGAYCQACHGVKGAGTPLTKTALKDVIGGMDESALTQIITDGFTGTGMPGFGKTLGKEQVVELVAYMRTLKK